MSHQDPRYPSPHVITTHLATLLFGAIIGALIILHTVVTPMEREQSAFNESSAIAADEAEGAQL